MPTEKEKKEHYKTLFHPDYIGQFAFADGEEKVVTIRTVAKDIEIYNPGNNEKEPKPVVYFKEKDVLPLILNSTNAEIISNMYGPYYEEWAGKPITLYVDHNVKVGGKKVGGLRVRPRKPTVTKPVLSPDSDKWSAAVSNLSQGNTSVDAIRNHYELSAADEKKLVAAAGEK